MVAHHAEMARTGLLGAVQFMVVLDIAIVNVALPSIQTDLGFSQANLRVISAYALVFGGFLLLGGRSADLLGRRRIFMSAWSCSRSARSSAASPGPTSLIGACASRARRRDDLPGGAGDPDDDVRGGPGAEHRARRLGAVGGFGAAAGVLLGGAHGRALLGVDLLRQHPGRHRGSRRAGPARREPRHAREELRRARSRARHLASDHARARDHAGRAVGLDVGRTIGVFALSAALLAGFVAWENRVAEPLMRSGSCARRPSSAQTSPASSSARRCSRCS